MIDNPQLDLSNVKDRGSKKWVAMMLPEHLKLIRSYKEEQKKIPRPQLDEWDLHAIEETINIAIKRKSDVVIKLWKDGEFILRGGIIQNVDLKDRIIEVDNPYGLLSYNLDDIVDVTVTD
ncbi:hypothetical protein AN959_03435 [Psychrobacillus sp. FJAT-21963]|nr:hypothetical protein AN959_03435 [Psychrobacillus sp. FJAT-21963]